MRKTSILLLSLLTLGCGSPKNSESESSAAKDTVMADTAPAPGATEVPIDLQKTKQKIEENRANLPAITGDFFEFKTYVQRLNQLDVFTISTTADYISVFLTKAKPEDRDSTYIYLQNALYSAMNNLTDSLYSKYPVTMKKFEENKSDQGTQNFEAYLKLFGMGLFMTEGMYYLDVDPDYFTTIFDKKVSRGLNDYIVQRRQEMIEGFSEDAGLVITFDQVYNRVAKWEKIMNDNPRFIMSESASRFYETYLVTLLTGMDNSRVFDFENERLLPEVKMLYEAIIKSGPQTKSTEVIKGYYQLLAANDFKHSPRADDYVKNQELGSMLGVQPHTR
jgi:hypothetical protein